MRHAEGSCSVCPGSWLHGNVSACLLGSFKLSDLRGKTHTAAGLDTVGLTMTVFT